MIKKFLAMMQPAKRAENQNSSQSLKFALEPLTPQFDESKHRIYVDALTDAIANKNIHNIALSGQYGVGKSSILQEVASANAKLKPITVSLSSLNAKPNAKTTEGSEGATNPIQKEIVKQLLYRVLPSRTPHSRYKRVSKYEWRNGWLPVFVIALLLLVALHLAGLGSAIVPFPDLNGAEVAFQYIVLYVSLALLVRYLHATTFNRIWIDKVTTGTTTLSLTTSTSSYFDEYLDELVYFFQVSKSQIVIFEDLDRFNDPAIFEELRALNTLLNNAEQLEGRSIRFIYAIKDSIFEVGHGEGSSFEDIFSNRTKFFDVIVPVVPFMTHDSARDLMTLVMGEIDHNISRALMRIALRHITDMRVLINIRNEFVIFRERVFGATSKESKLGLTEDRLFALVLYKNTHLSEFEKINNGSSVLDQIYRLARLAVNEEVERLIKLELELQSKLESLDAIASRSSRLGDSIIELFNRLVSTMHNPPSQSHIAYSMGGELLSIEDLKSGETWRKLVSLDIPLRVQFRGDAGTKVAFDCDAKDLEVLLGETLSVEEWKVDDQTDLVKRLESVQLALRKIQKADVSDLLQYPLDQMHGKDSNIYRFSSTVKDVLNSELSYDLVYSGYIDRNFTLYSAVYQDVHVSIAARNFLMKCIYPREMDMMFALSPEDVKSVLAEVEGSTLAHRGAYNVKLLDYLLAVKEADQFDLIRALSSFEEDEVNFLGRYWLAGEHVNELAGKLAKYSEDVLKYFASDVSVPDKIRIELFDAAMFNLDETVEYSIDEEVRNLLEENAKELTALTLSSDQGASLRAMITVIRESKCKFHDLSTLSEYVQTEVIAHSAYRITRGNLLEIVGPDGNLSLESILGVSERCYTYMLENIGRYLEILQAGDCTLSGVEEGVDSAELINDIVSRHGDIAAAVIERACAAFEVPQLRLVDAEAYVHLAAGFHFPATLANVVEYADAIGVDNHLGALLENAGYIDFDEDIGVEEARLREIAIGIVELPSTVLSTFKRAELVASLELEDELEVPDKVEPGELLGLLIEHEVISDTPETFRAINDLNLNWETKEFAISKSKKFSDFVVVDMLRDDEVSKLLESSTISAEVKTAVVSRSQEFVTEGDLKAYRALAVAAADMGIALPPEKVLSIANARVGAAVVMPALSLIVDSLTLDEINSILVAVGGDYKYLAVKSGRRLRFEPTVEHSSIMTRLQDLDTVSSFEVRDGVLHVNMKRQ